MVADAPPPQPPCVYLSLTGRSFHPGRWEPYYSFPRRFTCSYVFLSLPVSLSMTLCLLCFVSLCSCSLSRFIFLPLFLCPAPIITTLLQGRITVALEIDTYSHKASQKLFAKEVDSSPRAPPRAENISPVSSQALEAQKISSSAFSKASDL